MRNLLTEQAIEIDGSTGEGGGQILRTAVSLAAILRKQVSISNIRAGRKEPGLRPQHLQAVVAAAKCSNSSLSGAHVGSTRLEFHPSQEIPRIFDEPINTGTAGSITLIAQTLIPISMFGGVEIKCEISGGTEVPNSPTVDYLAGVVLPVYRKLGADISMDIIRRGYYPRGGGIVRLSCRPNPTIAAMPLVLLGQESEERQVSIHSISSSLPTHVAERQLTSAERVLRLELGSTANISSSVDASSRSLSPGSSILISSIGPSHFVGAISLGERGKPAEAVGDEAARSFLKESACHPGVDSHLADMLATLLPCVPGRSSFSTSRVTMHLETNMQIAKKLIPSCSFSTSESRRSVEPSCYEISVDGQAIRKV